eukprot:6203245-Pleurochrysis_carterae.AAC.1
MHDHRKVGCRPHQITSGTDLLTPRRAAAVVHPAIDVEVLDGKWGVRQPVSHRRVFKLLPLILLLVDPRGILHPVGDLRTGTYPLHCLGREKIPSSCGEGEGEQPADRVASGLVPLETGRAKFACVVLERRKEHPAPAAPIAAHLQTRSEQLRIPKRLRMSRGGQTRQRVAGSRASSSCTARARPWLQGAAIQRGRQAKEADARLRRDVGGRKAAEGARGQRDKPDATSWQAEWTLEGN